MRQRDWVAVFAAGSLGFGALVLYYGAQHNDTMAIGVGAACFYVLAPLAFLVRWLVEIREARRG